MRTAVSTAAAPPFAKPCESWLEADRSNDEILIAVFAHGGLSSDDDPLASAKAKCQMCPVQTALDKQDPMGHDDMCEGCDGYYGTNCPKVDPNDSRTK